MSESPEDASQVESLESEVADLRALVAAHEAERHRLSEQVEYMLRSMQHNAEVMSALQVLRDELAEVDPL